MVKVFNSLRDKIPSSDSLDLDIDLADRKCQGEGSSSYQNQTSKMCHKDLRHVDTGGESTTNASDLENLDEEELILWFGKREFRTSSREAKRMSLRDLKNQMGLDKNHRIRVEGTFVELPDESLISDLVKEGRTRLHSSPRCDSSAMCTICCESFQEGDAIVTNHECGHQLHAKCATKAFEFSTRCPCCRAQWKTYDEYCPQVGLMQKHNSCERELSAEDNLDFDPEAFQFDSSGPDFSDDIEEEPQPAPRRMIGGRPRSGRNGRRFLPRAMAESEIHLDEDEPQQRPSRRGTLRDTGRAFRFDASLLDLIDDDEQSQSPTPRRRDLADDLGGDSLDIDDEVDCHSCNRIIENADNALTCQICQRQECHTCGRNSYFRCNVCENHFHLNCDSLMNNGTCSYCTEQAIE